MAACRSGGAAIAGALRALDRSYFAILHAECRRMVRDADLAQELVHESFIKVWRRCATFNGDSELLPWIRAILRRTVLDQLRSPVRELPFDDEPMEVAVDQQLTAFPQASDSPEVQAGSQQSLECFERCWQRFESECPQHAAVIRWIAEDGLDNPQIAELLERSPGATREYISQCRKRARFYLAEWYALVLAP
jgi:RNA polymerase sigma-70 factor, ECF subfamily